MIRVRNLSKRFGRELILRNVSMDFQAGQCVGLVGGSGQGKTTLARCITGLESFDEGTIEIDDTVFDPTIGMFDARWVAGRRTVALVFQSRVLPPYRRVLDQIIEGPRFVLGMSRTSSIEHCMPWIDRLALTPLLERWPSQVSAGQLARVGLARAAVMNPRYLICDELTANLDERLANEILDALLELVQAGLGMILITHQQRFLKSHAAAVLQLEHGCLEPIG